MIVDGHEDIAFNVLNMGRDFTARVADTRAREGDTAPGGVCSVALPDLQAGGVGLVFGTLFTLPAHAMMGSEGLARDAFYHTPEQAHQQARAQLDIYHDLEERGVIRLVRRQADLASLRQDWQAGRRERPGLVVLMENAEPIREPDEVAFWQAQGVRIIGPAWQATRYCGGTGQPGPLTAPGRVLLSEMGQAGLLLDTSHMAEESFWQALDRFDGPLIASHSNCRALLGEQRADRHLSDEMIRALLARDAVIGVVLFNVFLSPDYERGMPKEQVGLDAVVRHIDHICQIAGDARHVAIGSDLDGGFGSESIPHELDSVADLPRLGEALRSAGYTPQDTAAILGENWLRVLEQGFPT